MFAYLVLLYDPSPHPLLCVEEPENQLYPQLMTELAEEFRMYAERGGQVLVSTHSPDFLNSAELDEACWLVKRNGCTEVHRARDNQQISNYVKEGDQLGYLWKQGFFRRSRSAMRELVFLLEEPSARAMLESLLPRILSDDIKYRLIAFEGKQDLEKTIGTSHPWISEFTSPIRHTERSGQSPRLSSGQNRIYWKFAGFLERFNSA
ncbi:AAA family ATPase [Xanthomonas dyei]|uniref:AAA family ATPase n=1 Tax=Xanthomonas dyei TaxID=743699 RepID=UPI003622D0BE